MGWRFGRPWNFWTAAFCSSSFGGSYLASGFGAGFAASAISDVEEDFGHEDHVLQVERPAADHLEHHPHHHEQVAHHQVVADEAAVLVETLAHGERQDRRQRE